MGVLQDFERRLEGAVEGFFARAFRSGLQPIELAKALQRYAEDNRHVTTDGSVVIPNEYVFRISRKDAERLASYEDLAAELADVVEGTATQEAWLLRGPSRVAIEAIDDVSVGRYELTARVVSGPRPATERTPPPAPPTPTPAPQAPAPPAPATAVAATPSPEPPPPAAPPSAGPPTLEAADGSARLTLTGGRYKVGRLASCDLVLEDHTVSREHAAVVKRGDRWWVLDLGSTNGTRVNGVQAAEQPLEDGDELTFGDAVVWFRGVS